MLAKAGDVYCVYNNYLKKYTACQITKIEEDDQKPQAVILSLDWSGEEPLQKAGGYYFFYTFFYYIYFF